MSIIIAATFAIICFGVAITGFVSVGDLTDAAQTADAKGYALFWTFLGAIAVATGTVSWWLLRTQQMGEDE